MTSQTKKFVELSDIAGMKLECRKCGVSLIVKADKLLSLTEPNATVLYQCPACGHGWTTLSSHGPVFGGAEGFDKDVKAFIKALMKMREYEPKLGFALTFELSPEPDQGRP